MTQDRKRKRASLPALLGVACGLGVALFLLGYFSGSSKRVPVVLVTGDKTLFEDISTKHERKLSVVRVPKDVKIQMSNVDGLEQLTRYKNEKKTLYAVDTSPSGSSWSEDIVIGFADGKKTDKKIWRCEGKTKDGGIYSFYSTFENCWGGAKSGKAAGFHLPRTNPGVLHMPVFSCLTPQKLRYLSLNGACESDEHNAQEMLGYVRAATVLVNDENKPADLKESEKAAEKER